MTVVTMSSPRKLPSCGQNPTERIFHTQTGNFSRELNKTFTTSVVFNGMHAYMGRRPDFSVAGKS